MKRERIELVVVVFLILCFCAPWATMAEEENAAEGKKVLVIYWQKGKERPPREDQAVDAAVAGMRAGFVKHKLVVLKEPVVEREPTSEEYFLNLAHGADADILVLFGVIHSIDKYTAFGCPRAHVNVGAIVLDAKRDVFVAEAEQPGSACCASSALSLRKAGEEAGMDAARCLVKQIYQLKEEFTSPLANEK